MLSRKFRYIYIYRERELDNGKTITYKLTFIDSFRFVLTSLSKLVHNLSEIYNKKFRDKSCKPKCEFKGLKNNFLVISKILENNS